jgi:hypothetical protein
MIKEKVGVTNWRPRLLEMLKMNMPMDQPQIAGFPSRPSRRATAESSDPEHPDRTAWRASKDQDARARMEQFAADSVELLSTLFHGET